MNQEALSRSSFLKSKENSSSCKTWEILIINSNWRSLMKTISTLVLITKRKQSCQSFGKSLPISLCNSTILKRIKNASFKSIFFNHHCICKVLGSNSGGMEVTWWIEEVSKMQATFSLKRVIIKRSGSIFTTNYFTKTTMGLLSLQA